MPKLVAHGSPSGAPVAASHSRAVWSEEAVTTRVPSGLNAADLTGLSWRSGGTASILPPWRDPWHGGTSPAWGVGPRLVVARTDGELERVRVPPL